MDRVPAQVMEVSAGSPHPSRINPAQSAASNASIARNRNGIGKRLGSDFMALFYHFNKLTDTITKSPCALWSPAAFCVIIQKW